MKYTIEEDLSNFEFWSGGKQRAEQFSSEELDEIGERIEELYESDGKIPTKTDINDMFWFDIEFVASLIGLETDENDEVIRNEES